MEFQSPPTSLTDDEVMMRADFQTRVNFTRDLKDASDFLKWQWIHTPRSITPLEIKYHILEDDIEMARTEFEMRSEWLENQHSPEEGRTFKAYGHRHEATTQHFAELAFRNGTVKYVVVWIEKDAEVTPDA